MKRGAARQQGRKEIRAHVATVNSAKVSIMQSICVRMKQWEARDRQIFFNYNYAFIYWKIFAQQKTHKTRNCWAKLPRRGLNDSADDYRRPSLHLAILHSHCTMHTLKRTHILMCICKCMPPTSTTNSMSWTRKCRAQITRHASLMRSFVVCYLREIAQLKRKQTIATAATLLNCCMPH